MKVLLLMGSARRNGTTSVLADSFSKGAEEIGHQICRIDCSKLDVHPCIGCGNCLRHGVCVWTDDMPKVEQAVLDCDVLVYVTPVYYAGVTSQLKVVMDRFYSFNGKFREKRPKLGLITAAGEKEFSSTGAVVRQFEEICKYVPSESIGMVNAIGCHVPEDLANADFLEQAYELGRSLTHITE